MLVMLWLDWTPQCMVPAFLQYRLFLFKVEGLRGIMWDNELPKHYAIQALPHASIVEADNVIRSINIVFMTTVFMAFKLDLS